MQVVKDVQGCKGSKPAKLDVFECTVTPGIAGVRSRAATRETGGKARGRESVLAERGSTRNRQYTAYVTPIQAAAL